MSMKVYLFPVLIVIRMIYSFTAVQNDTAKSTKPAQSPIPEQTTKPVQITKLVQTTSPAQNTKPSLNTTIPLNTTILSNQLSLQFSNYLLQFYRNLPVNKQHSTPDTLFNKLFHTNNYYHNFACLISGVKNTGSIYDPLLYSDSTWKRNAGYINASWHSLDTGRLEKISKWKEAEFPPALKSTTTVFYPFSGPDFLTAFAFFPDMDTIVMLGLEKVGRFPDMEKMTSPSAGNYALDLKSSLSDIFNKSYFITQHMQRQLSNQKVNGILPLITFFMERTGNKIADVNYLIMKNDSITKTSKIIEVGYNYNGKENPFGVKINYLHANKLCTAYYYRYNVANNNFADTSAFYLQLSKMNNFVTYMKSASYLLQNKTLSNMRDLILKKSNFILQDDTGEPFSFLLKDNKWDLKIYGQYTAPVKDFPYMYEDKLLRKAVSDNPKKSDLPFHLGYHWGNKKDLLILASKK